MSENKKPMTKAKKNFIASIIWLIAGVLFVITGAIMLTMDKNWQLIFGVVVLCCGSAVTALGIYMSIKDWKKMKKENAN